MGANAQTSVPLFVANSVLTAAQQNISAATGVPVFATTVTRDAAFGGSNKVLAEGQLCYLEATDVVQYYTGAAWATVGPATASALTFIKAQTVGSGVTSQTVTAAFSATYDNYLIIGSAISISAGAADIKLTLGGSAGSTYQNWGFFTTSGLAVTGNGGANLAYQSLGIYSTGLNSFTVQIQNPFAAAQTQFQSINGNPGYGGVQTGADTNPVSSTAFTIATANAMTGGTIRVYGYSNS
jgi:hypothetical protein